jgi:hypothetical protein
MFRQEGKTYPSVFGEMFSRRKTIGWRFVMRWQSAAATPLFLPRSGKVWNYEYVRKRRCRYALPSALPTVLGLSENPERIQSISPAVVPPVRDYPGTVVRNIVFNPFRGCFQIQSEKEGKVRGFSLFVFSI